MKSLEVLFTPVDFDALANRNLNEACCVVFDVLRATSTAVTALANGAEGVVPVASIPEALAIRSREPDALLAGEREGRRIRAALTGSIDFDLGNSPREFVGGQARGRKVIMSTTNGTRALRACAGARTVLACAFLNLQATAEFLLDQDPAQLLIIGSGTHEEAAYEDTLGAGALCELVCRKREPGHVADSALISMRLFRQEKNRLVDALLESRNGKRLSEIEDLRDDVAFCAQLDRFPLVAQLGNDGVLRKRKGTAETR